MPVLSKIPTISIIIPTLNSEKVLPACLKSIRDQKFDQSKIEILIADGRSSDNTLKIAKKYNCKIIDNQLKTAESGKAIGIKKAKGKYVALIDSDNILPNSKWLSTMLLPFKNKKIIGSEPWSYTYRPQGGFIERYSSLTGVNDPYSLVTNNFDRKNYLKNSWNGLNIPVIDYKNYQMFALNNHTKIPSIGANGTIYQTNIIKKYFNSVYLVDVDLLKNILNQKQTLYFAKVKCGIIHSYCESSIIKFIKKQNRRVVDLYIYQNDRPTNIITSQKLDNLKYVIYVILIYPMIYDTIKGYFKKPDFAWFFHPLACLITLYIYAINTIKYKLGLLNPINRNKWSQ